MKMQDVLLNDELTPDLLPCYDKDPDVTSYVIDGRPGVASYDQFPSYVVNGQKILTVPSYHRVHVPMSEPKDIDRKILALIKVAAEQGGIGVESSGSPPRIPGGFEVVIKPPGLELDLHASHADAVVEHADVESDRFYCLIEAKYLGRLPVRRDVLGNITELGFLIYNPGGIRTVFLEDAPKPVNIPAQA